MIAVSCSRWKLVCLLLASCGRINFDPRSDGATGSDDAPDATGDVGCWPAWKSGSPTLSAPRPVNELNSPQYEGDPYLAPDNQTFYLARATPDFDVWISRREERGMPFDPPVIAGALSSIAEDNRVSLSGDRLIAAISTDRPGSLAFDIWLANRATVADQFTNVSRALVGSANTGDNDYDPELSRDGLRLYYATGALAMHQISISTRMNRSSAFSAPSLVMTLIPAAITADVTLSPDELVIVYSATITTEPFDLYFATRASISDPFGPSMPLASINNPTTLEGDAAFSPDGCELFFSTTRTGQRDIYVADVQ